MPKIPLTTLALSAALATALLWGVNYAFAVHRSLEQFTSGQASIDQNLTEPIVVGPTTLLKVDSAERILVDDRVPFCSSWCFRTVFRKAEQYFQVDFELVGTNQLRPRYVNELYEHQVRELLLKDDPQKYTQWFGEPQVL